MLRHALDTKCVKKVLLFVFLLASCTDGGNAPGPGASPSGPPTIQPDVIERHAQQFEEELPDRIAGSQQEFAAATYITAHLQQAGYVVEFDAVPVANTVRSTNVVGLPPSTKDPDYLVTVAYDAAGRPDAIGTFLEVARALRAAVPAHSVEFVALGAESAQVDGGHLGTRRLIKLLQDRELRPKVFLLADSSEEGDPFEAAGMEFSLIAVGDSPVTPAEILFESLVRNSQ